MPTGRRRIFTDSMKPPEGVILNQGHPLGKDLRMMIGVENGHTLVRNYGLWAPTPTFAFGSAGSLWSASPGGGPGPNFQRSWLLAVDNTHNLQAGGFFGNPTSFTMAAWCNSTAGTQKEIMSLGDNHLLRTVNVRGIYRYASNWRTIDTGVNIENTGWRFVAFTVRAGTQVMYIDGIARASATNADVPIYDQGSTTFIGINGGGSGFNFGGNIGPCYFYARELSAAEIQMLYQQPFSMLRYRRRPFSRSAAAALTSTGDVTLPHPLVITASGGEDTPGTGDVTLPHPIVIAGVGIMQPTGVGGVTLPHPLVVTGTGEEKEIGQGDVTLPHPLVVTASGTPIVTTLGDVTLPHPLQITAAGSAIAAQGDVTLPHPLVVRGVGAPTFSVAANVLDRLVIDLEVTDRLKWDMAVLDRLAVDEEPRDEFP